MTGPRCDFRSYRECGCAPNECRVQDVGVFTGTAAARLLRSHQADARYSAGAFTALAIVILALIIAAAAQVAPTAV